MIEFDEATHTYRLAGQVVPSVTQIVRAVVPGAHTGATEWHMQRGTMVHKALALLVHGRLDWASVDPMIEGFVRAGQACLDDVWPGRTGALTELRMADDKRGFAGTADLLFHAGRQRVLVDWKSSYGPQAELQLGGYVSLIECELERWSKVDQAYVVELREDATYKLEPFNPARCRALFLAALTIYGWGREAGVYAEARG